MYRHLYSRSRAPWHRLTALVRHVSAALRGVRRLSVWQLVLATSIALALLVSLLWLAPWQGRHRASGPVPPPLPAQDSGHPGAERQLAAPITGSPEVSDAASVELRHSPPIAAESVEELDTQAMQELLARLEMARSSPEERLDTEAMDKLLATLEAREKPPVPVAPCPRAARRKQSRSLPRAAVDHGAHSFPMSPQQSDPALVSPAPEWSKFDPRAHVRDEKGG